MADILLPPITADEVQNLYNEELQTLTVTAFGVSGTNTLTYAPTGQVFAGLMAIGYLYPFLAVKYADDANGTNFSDSPTNRLYYALRNSPDNAESTNPADYTYYLTVGFGTTNFLWYLATGGRQVQFFVGTTAPSSTWVQAPTTAIDLDALIAATGSNGTSAFPLTIYFQGATPPATPVGGSFTLGTYVLTPPAGWTNTFPAALIAGQTVYTSFATVVTTALVGSVTPTWNTPVVAYSAAGATGATGATGAMGASGFTTLSFTVYARSATTMPETAPITPTGGSYDFGTMVFTPPVGWFNSPPMGTNVLYQSTTFTISNQTSGTLNIINWRAPTQSVQNLPNGASYIAGSNGSIYQANTATPLIYSRVSTGLIPTIPVGGLAVFSGTNPPTVTPPTGWFNDIQSITPSTLDPVWSLAANLATVSDTATYVPVWANPKFIFQNSGQIGTTVISRSGNSPTPVPAPSGAELLSVFNRSVGQEGDVVLIQYLNRKAAFRYSANVWSEAAGFIDGALVVSGTITANQIAAQTITTDNLQAGAVTASKLAVDQLSAITAITGSLVVGNQPSNPTNGFIQSANYVTGLAGYRIGYDGSAEFNSGTFRGAITANSINIGTAPTRNGTVMTGAGVTVEPNTGYFAIGDASNNMTYNGTILTLNGSFRSFSGGTQYTSSLVDSNNNTAIGATANPAGTSNVLIGVGTAGGGASSNNVAIGRNSTVGVSCTNNVIVGASSSISASCSNNVLIGASSSLSASIANCVSISGSISTSSGSSIAIGGTISTSSASSIVVGGSISSNAGNCITIGGSVSANCSNALALGRNSSIAANFTNSSAVGANATVTGSNQVQLGDASTTTYVYGTVQNRSDLRDKADVAQLATDEAWALIGNITPKKFKWNYRNGNGIRGRYHYGVVAQDIASLIQNRVINDFGGYQNHRVLGGEDVLSVGYDEFIAPLIAVVQDLQTRIQELEKGK